MATVQAASIEFYLKHYSQLQGKTVEHVGFNDDDGDPCFALVFTDGSVAWIQRDEEGNGPGFLEIQTGRA